MPHIGSELLLQAFRESNRQIQTSLEKLSPDGEFALAATHTVMSAMLALLSRIQPLLPLAAQMQVHPLNQEVSEFQRLVSRLRDLLPGLQARLLHERERIDQETVRLRTALQWTQGSRQTL